MAWDIEINPTAAYGTFPVALLPDDNIDDVTSVEFNILMNDVYNRMEFIKALADGHTTNLTNVAVHTGVPVTQTTAVAFGSSGVLNGVTDSLKVGLEAVDDSANAANTGVSNINSTVGGNVSSGTLANYSQEEYITNGQTHHQSIGVLDSQLKTTDTTAANAASTSVTNTGNITNLSNKVGDNSTDPGTGFSYDSTYFIANNDKLKVAVEKLDTPLFGHRRFLERVFEQTVLNWRDTSFGEFGGATPDNYFYESMTNTTKINAANSTTGAYDNAELRFGSQTSSWVYLSEIVTIPGTTDEIKMKFSVTGTVSVSVNFQGSFTTGFVSITDEDTFVSVPAGSQMVIKFEGGAGTFLYNYAAVYRG